MKCPADGQEMNQVSVVGIDNSWRCGKCGGCWIEGWTINALAQGKELKIQKRQGDAGSEGELHCPEDGTNLGVGSGNELPEGVAMWKCDKCKKWWLPDNSIFDLTAAFAVKQEYLKTWKRKTDLSVFTLPVVLTLVLVFGLGVILREVKMRQQLQIQAAVVRSTNVRYLGEGRAEVKMMVSGDLGVVEYRPEGLTDWKQAPVVSQGEWQVAVIENIQPGQKFLLRWNKGVVQLTVGQQE